MSPQLALDRSSERETVSSSDHKQQKKKDPQKKAHRKRQATRRERWAFPSALIGLLIICTVLLLLFNQWGWETPASRTTGSIVLNVEPSTTSLELKFEEASVKHLRFAVAENRAALRRGLQENLGVGVPGLSSCESATDGTSISCERKEDRLILTFERNQENDTPKSRWKPVWLLPFRVTEFGTIHVPETPIRWSGIVLASAEPDRITADASECEGTSTEDNCLVARAVLGSPRRVLSRDPQKIILWCAQVANVWLMPVVIVVMAVVNLALFGALVVCFGYWVSKNGLPLDPADAEAPTVKIEWRRALEWLEVIGPAVAFTGTVLSLTIAFSPDTYAAQDSGHFAEALSNAMVITACGLLMRILSFSVDRAINHLAHRHAARDGAFSFKYGLEEGD